MAQRTDLFKMKIRTMRFDSEMLGFWLFESWYGVLPIRLVVSPSGIGIRIVTLWIQVK